MSKRLALVACLASLVVTGCGGGAPEPDTTPVAATAAAVAPSEPTLVSAVLTTELNDEGLAPAAPTATEFGPETPQIFLVAELAGLPEGSELEAVWMASDRSKPLYTSTATAAGSHTLVSKLLPSGNMFAEGKYRVSIWVNRSELGGVHFSIGEPESRFTVVKELNLAAWVEVISKRPIDPKLSFRSGIKTITASFVVKGARPGSTIRVLWYKGDDLLIENDLEYEGTQRYALSFEQGRQINDGEYTVEVEVEGEMLGRRSFHVGGTTVSPVVDHVALGVAKGKAAMPKKHLASFKASTKGLRCGIGFLTLPDNAKVKVEWFAINEDGEQLLGTSETALTEGGKQVAVLDWTPEGGLASGPHKAVITLGSRKMAEVGFEIQ